MYFNKELFPASNPVRTKTLVQILNIAKDIAAHLVSSNLVMDVAVQYHMNYADYSLFCKCLMRQPMTELSYVAHQKAYDELHLSEIL